MGVELRTVLGLRAVRAGRFLGSGAFKFQDLRVSGPSSFRCSRLKLAGTMYIKSSPAVRPPGYLPPGVPARSVDFGVKYHAWYGIYLETPM